MRNLLMPIMWLAAVVFIVPVAYADHNRPGDSILQGVEYVDHRGTAAIKVNFTDEVEYVSVAPKRIASIYTIRFRFRSAKQQDDIRDERDSKSTFHPKEVLKPPVSPAIPLGNVMFTEDSLGPKLLLSFGKYVRIQVLPGPGANALTIKLPDIAAGVERSIPPAKKKPKAKRQPAEKPKEKAVAPSEAVTESTPKKLMRLGREALTAGENNRAIQIFTNLLSIEEHDLSQDALENLGIARERNDQVAHAKSIYTQYLEKYPKGEGTDRVRQRLADLIAHQLKPRKKLKQADESGTAGSYTSQTFGSFSQYYYFSRNDIAETDQHMEQSLLISQLSTSWRIRTANWDIRNYVYGNHDYDFLDDESGDFVLNHLYADIKNSTAGLYIKFGRQSGSSGGLLGRFDGMLVGYDLFKQTRLNMVGGFPVEYQAKTSVTRNKPFWGLNFEFADLVRNLDLAPYYIKQQVDGITDREAAGFEIRYFHPTAGNFFNLVDYDMYFDALNILLMRGQYNLSDKGNVNFNLDHRRSPLLQSSTATQSSVSVTTVEQLLRTLNEEEIRDLALELSGESTAATLGMSYQASDHVQFNADYTWSEQSNNNADEVQQTIVETKDKQNYVSTQFIYNRLLSDRDTYVLGLRWSDTSSYNNYLLSLAARLPVASWRWDFTYRIDMREDVDGDKLVRNRPTIKLDYRLGKRMELQGQLGFEAWRYSGGQDGVTNPDYNRVTANIGYHWNF